MTIYTIGYEGLNQKIFLACSNRKIVAEEIKKPDGNGMAIQHIKSLL